MDEFRLQRAFRGFKDIRREITANHRQHGLGLGIAKTAVVFDHLRSVRRQHEAEIEEAAVFQTVGDQTAHGRLHDLGLDAAHRVRVGELHGGHCAHAAGVWAFIAIADAFVVTRGHEDLILIIAHAGEDGDLRAGEAFFDQKIARAEAALLHHLIDELLRLRFRRANGHALAGGQSVELQHDGHLGQRGLGLGGGRADGEIRGRDAVTLQKLLRKALRGFELRGFLHRAPAWDACFGAKVRQTAIFDQPGLLTRDAEVDGVRLHPRDEFRQAGNVHPRRQRGDGIAARVGEEFVGAGRFAEGGEQRVLTSAFASDEDFHARPAS